MISAEWLLKNHKRNVSYAKMLEVQILHLGDTPTKTIDADGFIEDLGLCGKPLDGLPHAARYSSKTEEIAITYQERMDAEKIHNFQMLQQQLRQIHYYLRLYDAVVAGLDITEKWIVESHYLQSLSLNEMIRIAPNTLSNVSKSTICRKKKELLSKIDHYLQIVQAPFDEMPSDPLRSVRKVQSHIQIELDSPNHFSERWLP